jgi:hypothetical protein
MPVIYSRFNFFFRLKMGILHVRAQMLEILPSLLKEFVARGYLCRCEGDCTLSLEKSNSEIKLETEIVLIDSLFGSKLNSHKQ